jgi:hypothetical protein
MTAKKKSNSSIKQFLLAPYARIGIVICALLLVGAVAFLASHKSTPMYAHKSACSLFTLADAKKIVGNDTTGKSFPDDNLQTQGLDVLSTSCTYSHFPYVSGNQSYTDYINGVTKQLSIDVSDGHTPQSINYMQTGFDKAKSVSQTTPVKGLGDQAFYVPSAGGLTVLDANYVITISYYESPTAAPQNHYNQSVNVQVARQLIANIQK